jgi:asparagine synthase (glutamine-hydrolysing)
LTARLDPLNIATGMMLGAERRPPRLPDDSHGSALAALERAVAPALRRPPCLVSFSGGRDSSAVLAVAVRVARREGLAEPIPATNRFVAAPGADEAAWQERVVAHLQLDDWMRLTFDEELDVVGPYARRVTSRNGLLWPFNVHFHLPVLEAAGAGSVLTGIGGDELFASACGPVASWRPRAVARTLFEIAPPVVRRPILTRRDGPALPWLTQAADRALAVAAARQDAAQPRAPQRRIRWARGMRSLAVGPESLEAVASMTDAMIVNPLLDRHVWGAVARTAGRRGFDSRRHGLREVVGGLLPPELLERREKACFDEAFFTATARELAAAWSGGGVPPDLVRESALADHWRAPAPMAQSFTLLQAACLGSLRHGELEPLRDSRQHVPTPGPAQDDHRQ